LDAKSVAELFVEGDKLRRRLHEKHKVHRTVEESSLRFVVR